MKAERHKVVVENDGDGYGSVLYPDGEVVGSFQWNGGFENVRRYVAPLPATEE